MDTPERVLDALYSALFGGDTERALMLCAPDGQWHTLTPFDKWLGSYPIDMYVREVAPVALNALPEMRVESMERDTLDSLVVSRLRTSWKGDAGPREQGAGVMVARVVDGKVADIWSISADPSRPF